MLQIFNIRALFKGYVAAINCLIFVHYIRYTSETTSNDNGNKVCNTQSTVLNETLTSCAFVEEFIEKRTGRYVDFQKLLLQYAPICPMQDACDVKINHTLVYPAELQHTVTGCFRCKCDRSCAYFGNCCPGSHFGYVEYTCENTKLYPKDTEMKYYMVGSCLESYTDNKTVIELCSEEVAPCTGTVSQLIYKNKHCGKCNKEPECTEWKISVECGNAKDFQEQMLTFSSHLDMKRALDENNCLVKFQPPNSFTARSCNNRYNNYLAVSRVDKCNVSGLWKTYDADIDWACLNFITPYKLFKNVFCYICNPSHANIQPVPFIAECSSQLTNSTISEACSTMPVSDRYAPFKNVFCYVCAQGFEKLYAQTIPSLQSIKEENSLSLKTTFEMALQFDEDTFETFKEFVNNFILDKFQIIKQNIIPSKTFLSNNESVHFDTYEKIYTSICGTGMLCNESTRSNTTYKTYSNPVCKSCICNSTCAELDSCCFDTLLTRWPYSCYNTNMFPTFYQNQTNDQQSGALFNTDNIAGSPNIYKTIATCLNENVSINIRDKCRDSNDKTDRLSSIPVSTNAGMTYKNIYCYVCNNNKSRITLKIQAICNTFIEHKLFTKLDILLKVIKHHCQQKSFVPIQNKLCTGTYDSNKAARTRGEKFVRRELHPSKFEFRINTSIDLNETEARLPTRNVYEMCNKTGHNTGGENKEIIESLCESADVNVLSLPEYRMDNSVYKNFACFICNPEYNLSRGNFNDSTSQCLSNDSIEWYQHNEDLDELCKSTEVHPRWFPYKNMFCAECNLPPWQLVDVLVTTSIVAPAAAYTYIFTLSVNDFKHLDEAMETQLIPDCGTGTYDYFWKQCRPYRCFDGFQIVNSTCKPVLESVVRHEYELSFTVRFQQDLLSDNNSTIESNRTLMFDLEKLSTTIVKDILRSFDNTTVYMIKRAEYSASPCVRIAHANYIDLLQLDKLKMWFTVRIFKTENIGIVQTVLMHALNRQFNITGISDVQGVQHTIQLISTETNLKSKDGLIPFGCMHAQFSNDPGFESLQFKHFPVDVFLTCGHVKLNSSEVCMDIKSNNVSLKNKNATFSDTEYKIIDDNFIICGDLYSQRIYIEPERVLVITTDRIKSVLIVFSIVCTSISLLCLILTFITYCLISSLRTVAGKNIMALCASLFFAQALLQFGINAKGIHTMCVAIGISVHLFWLISFFAMNVCSFHTFKVFFYDSSNNMQPNKSKHSKNNLFLKYAVYILCLPLCIVVVTIVTNLIMSQFSDIGYGKFYCFISDFTVFILTFITPACLIFLSNIVFFSLAFHKIRCTPKAHGSRERNNFFICLKLFTIVGIAWPLLIIDNVFGITWFSFIVAGVNSLQGMFIFVSFVLNKHVASLIASSVLKKPTSSTLSKDTNDSRSSLKTYTDVETSDR